MQVFCAEDVVTFGTLDVILDAGWTVRASNPGGEKSGPGPHPAPYTMGTVSFPGVKRPGRGAEHPPPFSAEVTERIRLYIYSPSRSSWSVLG